MTRDNEKLNQLLSIKDNEVEEVKRANRASNVASRTNEALEKEMYVLKTQLSERDEKIL